MLSVKSAGLRKRGIPPSTPQNNIEAPTAAVARVSAPHRGDGRGMARSGQPVVNRGSDFATPNRGLACPRMAGDQQHDTLAGGTRPVEPEIDRIPGPIEVEAVKVDHPVRADRT